MEVSPFWEAATRSATQEFTNTLRNPKVHYRVYKGNSSGPYPEPDESIPYHPILFL
jgi:hypothetical protein